jgi:hypothetical protein
MNDISIACIVEGHGDVQAVPILVRRIVRAIAPDARLIIPHPPIRVPRTTLIKPGELERAVELAANKINLPGAILILIDADADCPAQLGTDLLLRANQARPDVPSSVVLANQEFEAWFLAAADSLRGRQGLSQTLAPPPDPEAISGAKEWLRGYMVSNRRYSETIDQPELTRHFDMTAARKASSFDKLWRDIVALIEMFT